MIFQFSGYSLDVDRRELRCGAALIDVGPQVFDLLVYLIRNRDRVVSRDDLLDAVWEGRIVSESTLTSRINAARRSIGDTGADQALIKTIARRGFRFISDVEESEKAPPQVLPPGIAEARPVRVHAVAAGDGRPDGAARSVGPPRLSLVVLPFANLGGGLETDYFVDGVTESLTTDLSRLSGALIIARNTAFAYRGEAVDVRQLGRDLNVRYVIEGSVQRSGDRMRVNVQLIEAETAAHVWAERFDKPVADLFEMQDEIVSRIANQLSAEIVRVEARRAETSTNTDALDFWFRGMDWINRGISPEALANARENFDRALAIDGDNVRAMLGCVMVAAIEAGIRSLSTQRDRLEEAKAIALRALAREANSPFGHFCLGLVLLFTRRAEEGIAELERALAFDSNLALAHAQIGFAKCVLGRPEEAEGHILEAMRLSPRDPNAYVWFDFLCIANLLMGRNEAALPWGRKATETNRGYPVAHLHYAAALALCGRMLEARSEAKAGLLLAPHFTVRVYREDRLSDNEAYLVQRERILEGLRLAGAPEG